MPWKASSTVSERLKFIARIEDGERVADLAREFGISEKTAYKFVARWKAEGVSGLEDRRRAAERIPHRTPAEIVELVLATRRENPSWGGRMLKARLERKHPGLKFPSATSIAYWLKKHGMVKPQRRRKKHPRTQAPLTVPTGPNHVWGTDFKGQFRLGDGSYCYPLTATDLCARYLLSCAALEDTKAEPAWGVFERLFDEYGLPEVMRNDNGPPFASTGLAGLTWLSAKWLRLGIRLERIDPGQPQQNGQHERMHRTLKQATTRPPGKNLLQQQERFDNFVEDFNHERPHQALGMKPPADFYQVSPRKYRGLPELDYPLADDVKVVQAPGIVVFHKRARCYLTQALVGERVGIREIDDDKWLITYAKLDLGIYDTHNKIFEPLPNMEASSDGISDQAQPPICLGENRQEQSTEGT